MSSIMNELPYSPELLEVLVADVDGAVAQRAARKIINRFADAGLPMKVKHIFPLKPSAYYRVLCFIKKRKETVILNTKQDNGRAGVVEGMTLQLRIENANSFAALDDLTLAIREQILSGGDCQFCSPKCDGKRYVFTYRGVAHTKCQMLCSNFRFRVSEDKDVESLLHLVEQELAFATQPQKRAK